MLAAARRKLIPPGLYCLLGLLAIGCSHRAGSAAGTVGRPVPADRSSAAATGERSSEARPPVVEWGFVVLCQDPMGFMSGVSQGAGGLLYAGTAGGTVYCLDERGATRWRRLGSGDDSEAVYGAPSPLPGGSVIVCHFDGRVRCLRADGQERWEVSGLDHLLAGALVGEQMEVYVPGGRSGVLAYSATGDERWSVLDGEAIRTVALRPADHRLVAGGGDSSEGVIAMVDPEHGTVIWQRSVAGYVQDPILGSVEGDVILGCSTGALYRIAADGSVVWSVELPVGVSAGLVPVDANRFVTVTDRGELVCVSTDGAVLWQGGTKHRVLSPPAVDPDRRVVACTSDDGAAGWVEIVSDTGEALQCVAAVPSVSPPLLLDSDDVIVGGADGRLVLLRPRVGETPGPK